MADTQYGLPEARNPDGSLKAVEHTFEWGGQDVTIKLTPPTDSQVQEYEALGDEASMDELRKIVDRHVEAPQYDEYTMRELNCFITGIMDHAAGGEMGEAIQAEIEARADGGEGN